ESHAGVIVPTGLADDLDGDGLAGGKLAGLVNHAHSTATDLADDGVIGYLSRLIGRGSKVTDQPREKGTRLRPAAVIIDKPIDVGRRSFAEGFERALDFVRRRPAARFTIGIHATTPACWNQSGCAAMFSSPLAAKRMRPAATAPCAPKSRRDSV